VHASHIFDSTVCGNGDVVYGSDNVVDGKFSGSAANCSNTNGIADIEDIVLCASDSVVDYTSDEVGRAIDSVVDKNSVVNKLSTIEDVGPSDSVVDQSAPQLDSHFSVPDDYHSVVNISDSVVIASSSDSVNGASVGNHQADGGGNVSIVNAYSAQELIELHEKIHASGYLNFEGLRIPLRTQLNIAFWKSNLTHYSDNIIVDYFEFGWPINYCEVASPSSCSHNHPTATAYPDVIQEYISTESKHGSLVGPFPCQPFLSPLTISPLHTVPKKGSNCAARRVVLDLSYPPDHSVNAGIPKSSYLDEALQLEYPSVDRLADLLVSCNSEGGAWMLKRDLSRAYRQLRIDPFDYNKLGFKWQDEFYFDISLPFGLRSASQACQRTTNGLAYILQQNNVAIINYVDDIAAVSNSEQEAWAAGRIIDHTILESGLCLAAHKSVNATQVMTFLGISFNSKKMTMEVTKERLADIQAELQLWSSRRKASKTEIQSLAGKLQFIAKCCKYGRCFMSRILAALKGLKRSSHRLYLNEAFRKDVNWWRLMLPHFNAVSIIKTEPWSSPDDVIATDACLRGGGGTFKDRFFTFSFPMELQQLATGISQLEALTVMVALKLWGDKLRGLRLTVLCDNSATVSVINTGRAWEPFLQACAREIVFLACKCEFELKAVHIRGVDNRLPDYLSRACLDPKYMDKFWAASDVKWIKEDVDLDIWKFSCPW
jgi:hypothetical protein